MMNNYPEPYYKGHQASEEGADIKSCPFGDQVSKVGDGAYLREKSQLCKRHWWLAGWHESRRERGLLD